VGVLERKEREKLERRKQILDAAEQIIFERGIESSSMEDIAAAAELSKGTVYIYFKGNDELYAALHLRGLDLLFDQLNTLCDAELTAERQLELFIEGCLSYYKHYPDYLRINLDLYSKRHTALESQHKELFVRYYQFMQLVALPIEQGIETGVFNSLLTPLEGAFFFWTDLIQLFQFLTINRQNIEGYLSLNCDELAVKGVRRIFQSLRL